MGRTQSKIELLSEDLGGVINPSTEEKQDDILDKLSTSNTQVRILYSILEELKIMNKHLSLITEVEILDHNI